ncbi:hypothetical protein G9A89_008696 [Geosiphon pyriformis]|nr:hypothetical protein G9A89_008696 [Geosiphon pyriformis]
MTTVLIDNYDSFTWNIYQYLSELGANVQVFRNDQTTIEHITSLKPINLLISPGPGHPSKETGISREAILHFAGKIPILGICLGEQCIFEVFGGKVAYAGEIVHGKTSKIKHDSKGLFINVPLDILATRYHSLSGQPPTVPEVLEVTSWTENGVIMGIRHREFTIEGVQFHPESVISEHGKTMLSNFLKLKGGIWNENPTFGIKIPLSKVTVQEQAIHSILQKIHKQRLEDIAAAKKMPGSTPNDFRKLLSLNVAPPLIDFVARIKQNLPKYPAILAEVKRASPSKGNIDLSVNAAEQALSYAKAGASTISVLTEEKWFKGTLNDLRQVRDIISSIPNRPAILRKDFIVDTYQIMEARLYGADTVLLIVALLSDSQLLELYKFAKNLGMEPLVEVNNEEEMKRAIKLGAQVIGVNNRNLNSFDVDMQTTSRLAEMVPEGVILAALSGITRRQDVIDYLDQGVGALLIGEALMRAENKRTFIHEILGIEEAINSSGITFNTAKTPLVKICGVSTVEAAMEAVDAGADLIGLIFAKSKRQVSIDSALEIVTVIRELQFERQVEIDIKRFTENKGNILSGQHDWFQLHASRINHARKPLLVGVFQNQTLEEITVIVDYLKLDLIQLHGDEPLDLAKFLPVPVIKAFHIDEEFANPTLVTQAGYNAYCLLDTKVKGSVTHGGAGVTFDWNIALSIKKSAGGNFPLILSGGLTPENVKEAVKQVKPWAVDVSSGIETENIKDPQKIKDFIKNAKSVVYNDDDDGGGGGGGGGDDDENDDGGTRKGGIVHENDSQ